MKAAAVFALGMLGSACATYKDGVARAELVFEQTEYDRALAILRDLEPDYARLTPGERARYAYLRGMADLRMGMRVDARHWLAVARAENAQGGSLPLAWSGRLEEALTELDAVVVTEGIAALARPARAVDLDAEAEGSRRRRAVPASPSPSVPVPAAR